MSQQAPNKQPSCGCAPSLTVVRLRTDTYKYCSPTRGSFLSGRLPFHLDATRCNIIPWTLLDGLNLEYTLLPQKLKTAGYATHHVGKVRHRHGHPSPLSAAA